MKKRLIRTMLVLLAVLLILVLFFNGEKMLINVLTVIDIILLVGVFIFYTCRYAGICCPHCEIRLGGKYIQRLNRDGCVICPHCGAMIER